MTAEGLRIWGAEQFSGENDGGWVSEPATRTGVCNRNGPTTAIKPTIMPTRRGQQLGADDMLLRMNGRPHRPAVGWVSAGDPSALVWGNGLATAAKSSRIVAAHPDPVKHAVRELAFYVRFGNAIAGELNRIFATRTPAPGIHAWSRCLSRHET